MSKKIYITGLGAISSIGDNVQEILASIRNSRHGIQHIKFLDTSHKGKLLVGEVKKSNKQLAEYLQSEKVLQCSRTTLLGIAAAREAVADAGFNMHDGLKTGIISSTSVGGIDKTENFFKKFFADPASGKLRNITSHDCGDSTENIAIDLGIYHYVSTISTACSSSANAIMTGARLIKHNILDRVIVGGTDALTKYTLNGFNALKILDTEHCKPFDQNRNGLNLGEGAAYLVLESEKSLRKRNGEPLCYLSGYGNANDAYHQTASSPEGNGAYSAMELALRQSNYAPEDIDYVNVHGTATYVNDLSEGTAMTKLFKEAMPPFSSTKSFTGHTLAAAGSIEAVISVLNIKNRFIAPNLNFKSAIEDLNMTPIGTLQEDVDIKHILSNSFGFGGNCSALVISAL
jgi:3-oxoacyl-[acyl-carrier-protein] synthase-1